MKDQKREFTGVWIPREVIEDDRLNMTDRMVYAEIACFNECYKSNEMLGERYGLKKGTISGIVSKLVKLGYVASNNKTGDYRILMANPRGCRKIILEAVGKKSYRLSENNPTIEYIENTEENKDVAIAPSLSPSYEEGTRMKKKPRTPREFANARRADIGKPPLQPPPRTDKQDIAVKALKLIDFFKKTFYEKYGEGVDTYFGGDSEENGKYAKLAKGCILLLGEDSEQYVRDWIGGLGEFFQYDPSNCWSASQMKKWKVSKKIKQKENIIKPEYL